MIAAVACFTTLDTILKILVQHHDPWFLAWGRNLFQVAYLTALMSWLGRERMLRTSRPLLHAARGGLLLLTTVFIILALRHLPMAQTYAITFSTPLIATVVAALALGERPSSARWIWIVLGLAGVLVDCSQRRPRRASTSSFSWGWRYRTPCSMC
jgi:drug/metabolite transporter (DMT)-like permease